MSRTLDCIAGHGHTLIVATIAFLAGMAIMLPTGVTLPDSAAALIGAVIGAVATIGGALLLWRVQEAQRTRHLAKSIAMQFGEVFHASFELISQLAVADHAAGTLDVHYHGAVEEQVDALERLAADLLLDIDRTRKKLDRFSQALHLLTSDQVGELMLAEAALDAIQPIAERVSNWFVPGVPSATMYLPTAMAEAKADLRGSYDYLGETLERFAPEWSKEL
ncbi:hypothetical protein [Novilysobacter antarcticus]|uniref:hypothetical protein n=1 Tax=Novilysobacter antarcticus TaxID=2862543 RepID=UPI001C9A1DE5|nr:hypothetical protein [Lysobacter antarcticus]